MYVKIDFPKNIITLDQKRQYAKEVILWAYENLNDKDTWHNHLKFFKKMYIVDATHAISFNIPDEEDAMALILRWS